MKEQPLLPRGHVVTDVVTEDAEMLAGCNTSLLLHAASPESMELTLLASGSLGPPPEHLAVNPQRGLLHRGTAPQSPPQPSPSPSTWVTGCIWILTHSFSSSHMDLHLLHIVDTLIPIINPLPPNAQWLGFPD